MLTLHIVILVTAASSVAASRVNKIAMDNLLNELEETAPSHAQPFTFNQGIASAANVNTTQKLVEKALDWLSLAITEIGEESEIAKEKVKKWLPQICWKKLEQLLSQCSEVLSHVMLNARRCQGGHYAFVEPKDHDRALEIISLSSRCLAMEHLNLTKPVGKTSKNGDAYIINLCHPYFWKNLNEEQQVATLIHEATHHWGTADIGFTSEECAAGGKLNAYQACNNAQNYAFFVMEVNGIETHW